MDDSCSSSAGMEMIRDKFVVASVRHCRTDSPDLSSERMCHQIDNELTAHIQRNAST